MIVRFVFFLSLIFSAGHAATAVSFWNKGCHAFNHRDYREARAAFQQIIDSKENTPLTSEAYFFRALCFYHLSELDLANLDFNSYIRSESNPRYFIETCEYKYAIADRFRRGAKKRFYSHRNMPRLASGYAHGVEIYEELYDLIPAHEIGQNALFSKGCLLLQTGFYQESVDTFQAYITRYSTSPMVPDAYLMLSRVYLERARKEDQNFDLMVHAKLNLEEFSTQFPREEKVCLAEANFRAMEEIFVKGLFQMGAFYERTCKPRSAVLYYHRICSQFPNSRGASVAKRRLLAIDSNYVIAPECIDACVDEIFDLE